MDEDLKPCKDCGFRKLELQVLRLAIDTLKAEREEILAAKKKDATMALRLYNENRDLKKLRKGDNVKLRKALEEIVRHRDENLCDSDYELAELVCDFAEQALKEVGDG